MAEWGKPYGSLALRQHRIVKYVDVYLTPSHDGLYHLVRITKKTKIFDARNSTTGPQTKFLQEKTKLSVPVAARSKE
jgi:hypothetical protein